MAYFVSVHPVQAVQSVCSVSNRKIEKPNWEIIRTEVMWVLTKLELNRKGKKSQFGITNGVPCRINTKEKAKSKQTEL